MRPNRGAGGEVALAGAAVDRERTSILAERDAACKQAAPVVWCIEFAVNLQRADVSLLALGFVEMAS